MTTLPLPLIVDVATNGAVGIGHANGVVGMSRFSGLAARIATALGTGEHVLQTAADVDALPADVVRDVADYIA